MGYANLEKRRAYYRAYMRLRRAKERELRESPAVKQVLDDWADPLFTVGEAASLLQICSETIRRWCRKGILPHVQGKKGGCYLIPASALEGCRRRWRRGLTIISKKS